MPISSPNWDPRYSLIYAEKNLESVFEAIRQNKLKIVSRPLKHFEMGSIANKFLRMKIRGTISKRRPKKIFGLESWGNSAGKATLVKTKDKIEMA